MVDRILRIGDRIFDIRYSRSNAPISNIQYRISRTGFTLIELMVVITITGILASVAVANFNGARKSSQVRLAAENFAAFLRTTETMSRAGVPLPVAIQKDCKGDGIIDEAPCGGYGIVVEENRYYRFGDQDTPNNRSSGSEAVLTEVKFEKDVSITTNNTSEFPYTVIFVPPKDIICVRDNLTTSPTCGPATSRTLTFKVQYKNGNPQKTVKLNTVSGLVSVE